MAVWVAIVVVVVIGSDAVAVLGDGDVVIVAEVDEFSWHWRWFVAVFALTSLWLMDSLRVCVCACKCGSVDIGLRAGSYDCCEGVERNPRLRELASMIFTPHGYMLHVGLGMGVLGWGMLLHTPIIP